MEIIENSNKISKTSNLENKINNPKKIELLKQESLKSIEKKDNFEVLNEIVKDLNNDSFLNNKIKFNVENKYNAFVVKVLDFQTEQLIVQYPAEEFLKNVKYYKDNENILLNIKV